MSDRASFVACLVVAQGDDDAFERFRHPFEGWYCSVRHVDGNGVLVKEWASEGDSSFALYKRQTDGKWMRVRGSKLAAEDGVTVAQGAELWAHHGKWEKPGIDAGAGAATPALL